KAGIKSGDIIVEFNGSKIKDERDLVRRVAATPVGTNAPMRFIRDGQPHTVTVKLGERPATQTSLRVNPRDQEEDGDAKPTPTPAPTPGSGAIGVEVETFTARKADQLSMKPIPGVLITNVLEGSIAEDVGLRRNYIILQVDRQPVTTAEEF